MIAEKSEEVLCSIHLASVYLGLGEPSKARTYVEHVVGTARDLGNKDREQQGYLTIGNTYVAERNFPKAAWYFNKSLQLAKQMQNSTEEALSYMNLGSSVTSARKARKYYRKAYIISRHIGAKVLEMKIITNMGFALYERHPQQAYGYLERSLTLFERIGKTVFEEANKLTYYGLMAELYHKMITLCHTLSKLDSMFAYVERSKSKAFLDIIARTEIVASPQLRQAQDLLAQERQYLVRLWERQTQPVMRDQGYEPESLTHAIEQLEAIYAVMETLDPEYVFMRKGSPLALTDIRRLLLLHIS
jgi:tetratricopeptide (TPR) repeat protein